MSDQEDNQENNNDPSDNQGPIFPPPPPLPPPVDSHRNNISDGIGSQPPQAGAYNPNGQGAVSSKPENDSFAITSLVVGSVALIMMFCCGPLVIPVGIVSIVFGFLSLGKIKDSNGTLGGKGMALAGIWTSAGAIILAASWVVISSIFDVSSIFTL